MTAVPELPVKDEAFKLAQRRRHRLRTLAELDELVLDRGFRKAGLDEPRLQVPEIPAIKTDLGHMMLGEDFAPQVSGHVFV